MVGCVTVHDIEAVTNCGDRNTESTSVKVKRAGGRPNIVARKRVKLHGTSLFLCGGQEFSSAILILSKNSSGSEVIERHPIGANTSRGHLHYQLRSCVETTCVEVRVKQSVVARDVQAIDTLYSSIFTFLKKSTALTRSPFVQASDDRRGMPLLPFDGPQMESLESASHTSMKSRIISGPPFCITALTFSTCLESRVGCRRASLMAALASNSSSTASPRVVTTVELKSGHGCL